MVRIPTRQRAIATVNIGAFRQCLGRNQAKPGELMGWPSPSIMCAADGRQRGSTAIGAGRLAATSDISAWRLTARCPAGGGCPPAGSACLARAAITSTGQPGSARHTARHRPAAVCW